MDSGTLGVQGSWRLLRRNAPVHGDSGSSYTKITGFSMDDQPSAVCVSDTTSHITAGRAFAKGIGQLSRGWFSAAEATFESVARLDPRQLDPAMTDMQTPAGAAAERLRVLRSDSAFGEEVINRVHKAQRMGNLARRSGEHAEAIRAYNKALSDVAGLVWKCRAVGVDLELSMKKTWVTLLTNRAQSHLAMSHLDEAASDARAALGVKGLRDATGTRASARLCVAAVKKQEKEDARAWRPQKHNHAPKPPSRELRRQRTRKKSAPTVSAKVGTLSAQMPRSPSRDALSMGNTTIRRPSAVHRGLSNTKTEVRSRRRVQEPTDDFDLLRM